MMLMEYGDRGGSGVGMVGVLVRVGVCIMSIIPMGEGVVRKVGVMVVVLAVVLVMVVVMLAVLVLAVVIVIGGGKGCDGGGGEWRCSVVNVVGCVLGCGDWWWS